MCRKRDLELKLELELELELELVEGDMNNSWWCWQYLATLIRLKLWLPSSCLVAVRFIYKINRYRYRTQYIEILESCLESN